MFPSRLTAENGLTQPSWTITNKIFTIDRQELQQPLGRISKEEMYQVKEGLKTTLAL